MKDARAKDAKLVVLGRLLELARLQRRKGTPEEAAAVLPYEQMLEHDLQEREAELAQLPGLEQTKQAVAA